MAELIERKRRIVVFIASIVSPSSSTSLTNERTTEVPSNSKLRTACASSARRRRSLVTLRAM